jgi:hypothetical protein
MCWLLCVIIQTHVSLNIKRELEKFGVLSLSIIYLLLILLTIVRLFLKAK